MLSPRALSKGTKGSVWYVSVRLFYYSFQCIYATLYLRSLPEIILILNRLTRRHYLQQKIRDFLKVRTSYDVLPLSFRLIIFDTALLVKKSLTILIQNGNMPPAAPECSPKCTVIGRLTVDRHRLRTAMGLHHVLFCRTSDYVRLSQPHPILLAES